MNVFIKLLLVALTVANAIAQQTRSFMNSQLNINGSQLSLVTSGSSVNFFAIGDWGGIGLIPVATPSGFASAQIMGTLGAQYNTAFQLGLGDNFYLNGTSNVNDPQFKTVFEDTYQSSQLLNTPWFHTLGNHDHYGNAQSQIDYMNKSNRWIMPAYNYTVNVQTSNGQKTLISILVVDTILLCGNSPFNTSTWADIISNLLSPSSNSTPYFTNATQQALATLYFKDLESKLKAINATGVPYILVTGHFPVYSVAEHGSTQCLINNLMPLLHKYKVSAYLNGHDHNLQHISYTNPNYSSTVEYFVVGANALNTYSQANIGTIPSGSLKFQWPTSSDSTLTIDSDGGVLMIEATTTSMTFNFVHAYICTKYCTIFGLNIPCGLTYCSNIIYSKVINPRS